MSQVGHPVDDLAQDIRRVDGSHSLGAGALAQALHDLGWRRRPDPRELTIADAALRLSLTGVLSYEHALRYLTSVSDPARPPAPGLPSKGAAMSANERAQKFDDVQPAIEEVHWRFTLLCGATDTLTQARSLTNLADAVSDLATWHDSWDVDSGTLSWEREDAAEGQG